MTVDALHSMTADVADAAEALDALAELQAAFGHAFDGAPTGMLLVGLDGRILRANAAFGDLLGRAQSELLGGTVEEITHPDDREQEIQALVLLRTGSATSSERYTWFARYDETSVRVRVRTSVITDRSGHPTSALSHVERA